jgi:hypothetical protein
VSTLPFSTVNQATQAQIRNEMLTGAITRARAKQLKNIQI